MMLEYKYKEVYQALSSYNVQKSAANKTRFDRVELYAFYSGMACFVIAVVIAIISSCFELQYMEAWSFRFVLLSQLSFIANHLLFILSSIRYIKNIIPNFLLPLAEVGKQDFIFANSLSSYDKMILKSVKDRIDYESEAMYSRMGVIVGSIDKTGFIIFAFTSTVAFLKLNNTLPPEQDYLEYVMYVVAGLYIAAMLVMSVKRKLDKFSMLLGFAIDLQQNSNRHFTRSPTATGSSFGLQDY